MFPWHDEADLAAFRGSVQHSRVKGVYADGRSAPRQAEPKAKTDDPEERWDGRATRSNCRTTRENFGYY